MLKKFLFVNSYSSLIHNSTSRFALIRKAKTFKEKKYPVIPSWMVVNVKDPFEYKLRSKEEIIKEQEKTPPDFQIKVIYTDYVKTRFETNIKNRKIKIQLNMQEMNLTKLQRKRLIQLIGPRYKNSDVFALTCDIYPEWEQNFIKVMEMARELYWEAKRAP